MFAKLYETSVGQILVKLGLNDAEQPEVRFFFQPSDLGVCSIAIQFNDDEEGEGKAQKLFAAIDEEAAIRAVREVEVRVTEAGLEVSDVRS